LGIIDELMFGPKFDSIREAGKMNDEWKRRFDAQDNAKTLSVPADTGNTTGGEDEMAMDEGSVVGTSTKGTRRQTRNTSTVEVTISKAPTPVSNRTFGFD
jgi:hypothetical protein